MFPAFNCTMQSNDQFNMFYKNFQWPTPNVAVYQFGTINNWRSAVPWNTGEPMSWGSKYLYPPTEVDPNKPRTFYVEEVKLILTEKDLVDLVMELNAQKEFAVDVEHWSRKTCLIQISTRSTDYVIDTLKLWRHMHLLSEPFKNPAIVKVFHAPTNDMIWLNRDFGLEVENLFDTQTAMANLRGQFQGLGLKSLVLTLCGICLDKEHQKSNWMIRPLPKEMLDYAAQDTHYLLFCYDELRNRLIKNGKLEVVLKGSEKIAAKREKSSKTANQQAKKKTRKPHGKAGCPVQLPGS
uniref:3'-5' exonuclease domain-containing protein n=1 Tax=Steinernema glaseri TaxID=37863 RepID=A0A1I7ZXH2_9BILA